MIFLVLGILNGVAAITVATLSLCLREFTNPAVITSLVILIIECILCFALYGMRSDINANRERISALYKAVNQCRKKLGLKPVEEDETEKDQQFKGENEANKNECPSCFHKITQKDTECPYCGFKLK